MDLSKATKRLAKMAGILLENESTITEEMPRDKPNPRLKAEDVANNQFNAAMTKIFNILAGDAGRAYKVFKTSEYKKAMQTIVKLIEREVD